MGGEDALAVGRMGESSADDYVLLDIPAKAEYVVLGRLALTGMLRAGGYSDDAVADLKLALTEACSNSIRHAYPGSHGQIHLRLTRHSDRLVVEIGDDGQGFDLDAVDARVRGDDDEYAEGGMGASIIRAVVDECVVTSRFEGGTRVVLTKLRSA